MENNIGGVVLDYNSEFIEQTFANNGPMYSALLEIKLSWTDSQKNKMEFYLYPTKATDSNGQRVIKTNKEGEVEDTSTLNNFLNAFNFFREFSITYSNKFAGNIINLTLFDPTGYVLDNLINDAFVQSGPTAFNGLPGVYCSIKYGWTQNRMAESEKNFILTGINATPEYTGLTMTLSFFDVPTCFFNTKVGAEKSAKNINQTTNANGFTLPQAIMYMFAMVSNQPSSEDSGQDYNSRIKLIREKQNSGDMESTDWFWDNTKWPAKDATDWFYSQTTLSQWLNNHLAQAGGDSGKKRYTFRVISSGSLNNLDVNNLEVFDASQKLLEGQLDKTLLDSSWVPFDSSEYVKTTYTFGENENKKTVWRLNEKYNLIMITVEGEKQKDDTGSERLIPKLGSETVVKKYNWLSTDKDPYNTVVGCSFTGTNLYGIYMMRRQQNTLTKKDQSPPSADTFQQVALPNSIPLTSTTAGTSNSQQLSSHDMAKDFEGVQGMQEKDYKGIKVTSNPTGAVRSSTGESPSHTSPSASTSTSANPELDPNLDSAIDTSTDIGAMYSIQITLEVLGDPDLTLALQNCIFFDFPKLDKSENNPLDANGLPGWLRGKYFVISITDKITGGDWTTSLNLLKFPEKQSAQQDNTITQPSIDSTSNNTGYSFEDLGYAFDDEILTLLQTPTLQEMGNQIADIKASTNLFTTFNNSLSLETLAIATGTVITMNEICGNSTLMVKNVLNSDQKKTINQKDTKQNLANVLEKNESLPCKMMSDTQDRLRLSIVTCALGLETINQSFKTAFLLKNSLKDNEYETALLNSNTTRPSFDEVITELTITDKEKQNNFLKGMEFIKKVKF